MRLLTEDAKLVCKHMLGVVQIIASQGWVTINGRRALVKADPEGRTIGGCPNYGVSIKPCTSTLAVEEGYSHFIRIDGRPVCLDTVTGLTDGTPPGVVKYIVVAPGQGFVAGSE